MFYRSRTCVHIIWTILIASMTILWCYSVQYWHQNQHFRYKNAKNGENELCNKWTLIDRTISKCEGKRLSWGSLVSNFSVASFAAENPQSKFKPKLTTELFTELMDVLEVFVSMCKNSSIPWMLSDGSLLGAVRHFGIIPWDDDIDVMVDVKYQDKLRQALSTLNNSLFQIFEFGGIYQWQWKFHIVSNRSTYPGYDGKNPYPPFIDVFFYVYETPNVIKRKDFTDLLYNTDDLFPVKLRPFEEFLLPTPKNAIKILDNELPGWNKICVIQVSHITYEEYHVKCEELYDLYPFVFRLESAMKVETSLKLGGKSILTLERQNVN